MNFIDDFLKDEQYYHDERLKKQIVLHHSVSSTVKSMHDWFDQTPEHVGVAFAVAKNGDVHKFFEPECWAYHIGKGSSRDHNRKSIGIEIVNEGALEEVDGQLYWFNGKQKYDGEVVTLDEEYRGYKNFAAYTKEQADSTHELLGYLFERFRHIERRFSNTFEYNPIFMNMSGVVMHVNLREDKTDLSPAWDIDKTHKIIDDIDHSEIPKPRPVEEVPFNNLEAKAEELAKEYVAGYDPAKAGEDNSADIFIRTNDSVTAEEEVKFGLGKKKRKKKK